MRLDVRSCPPTPDSGALRTAGTWALAGGNRAAASRAATTHLRTQLSGCTWSRSAKAEAVTAFDRYPHRHTPMAPGRHGSRGDTPIPAATLAHELVDKHLLPVVPVYVQGQRRFRALTAARSLGLTTTHCW